VERLCAPTVVDRASRDKTAGFPPAAADHPKDTPDKEVGLPVALTKVAADRPKAIPAAAKVRDVLRRGFSLNREIRIISRNQNAASAAFFYAL